MQLTYPWIVLVFVLLSPCTPMPQRPGFSDLPNPTMNVAEADASNDESKETNEYSEYGSDNEEDTSAEDDTVALTPNEENQDEVNDPKQAVTETSDKQTESVTEQVITKDVNDIITDSSENDKEEFKETEATDSADILLEQGSDTPEEVNQSTEEPVETETEVEQMLTSAEAIPLDIQNRPGVMNAKDEANFEKITESSEDNGTEKETDPVSNSPQQLSEVIDGAIESPQKNEKEKAQEETSKKEVRNESVKETEQTIHQSDEKVTTRPPQILIEENETEKPNSEEQVSQKIESNRITLQSQNSSESPELSIGKSTTEEKVIATEKPQSENEIREKLLKAEGVDAVVTEQPTKSNVITESANLLEEPSNTEVAAMKLFSFELPLFNESLHRELLMNESEWAKQLAEAEHPDEPYSIQDPCSFISENIQNMVGLNVTREQVFNTLPTLKFFANAETEDLTTIREMLLTCVKGSPEDQESSNPACAQIKALIVKTCRDYAECRAKEDQIMSKAMRRIREVIDTDQIADALLMLRACAAQEIE